MVTDEQFKKVEKESAQSKKEISQIKKIVNTLINRIATLEVENNRLKHVVHGHTNEIARIGRKQ